MLSAYQGEASNVEAAIQRGEDSEGSKGEKGIKHFLDASKEALLEAEREFLSKTLAFMQVSTHIRSTHRLMAMRFSGIRSCTQG